MHDFDQALQLTPIGDPQDGVSTGTSSPRYWNMVGPFGGATAAIMLKAALAHPDCLGDPIALTVNFAAALAAGSYTVTAKAVKTNRSTQHWTVEMTQIDSEGARQVLTTATVVTAVRRETWGTSDCPMPEVPHAQAVEALSGPMPLEWLRRYEMRPVAGAVPTQWDGAENPLPPEQASLSRLWVRDVPPRPLDFASLAALCDVFYPRVWLRRALMVPAGTVSITVYFHAGADQLAATGDNHVLGQARGQGFRNGFFDQAVQLWNPAGTLLATSHQIVYYKA